MANIPFPKKPLSMEEQKADQAAYPHSTFLVMSKEGYRNIAGAKTGQNVYWTTDIRTQLPIHMESGDTPSSIEPITIPQLLERNVREVPDKEAMHVERGGKWFKWTWAQYFQDAKKFGKAMMSLQVNERACTNIIGFNSPEWFIAFTGSILANAVPSGVYTTNGTDACLYIAKNSEAEVIVCEDRKQLAKYEAVLDELSSVKAFIVFNDQLPANRRDDPRFFTWKSFLVKGASLKEDSSFNLRERIAVQKPGMCCNIVYTSGTTGPPKGVMLSHDNMMWSCHMHLLVFQQMIEIQDEKIVSYLPLSHIAAQITDYLGNIRQRTCVYFARPDALQGSLVDTLKKVKPTIFVGVPRVYEKFEEKMKEVAASKGGIAKKIGAWAKRVGYPATLRQLEGKSVPFGYSLANMLVYKNVRKALGLSQNKMFLFGAAPMKKSTIEFFASLNIPLQNCYGMSETTGVITMSINKPHWNNLFAAGTPLPGTHVKIMKANPSDKDGEICFKGRHIFMGYLKNEKETRKVIDDEGYAHSGDLGYFDEKGFLHITGRLKELIITAGGENVAPVLIEDKLKELCPIVSNVMVVGDDRKFLGAVITLKSIFDLQTGEGEDKLPDHAIAALKSEGVWGASDAPLTPSQMLKDDKILKYIESKVQLLNEKHVISRAQQIRKWVLVGGDFSVKGGQLTPTMKLRRKVAAKIYGDEIESLYREPKL